MKYLSQAAVSPGGVRALGRLAGFVDRALGLWADAGFDAARGLYAERLDFSGARDAQAPYRAMVQARQIYVFADAARRGGPASYGERALEVMQRVIGAYMAGDPARGSAFSLGPGGEIVSARRDAYTHAFLLFALAAVHRLAPEPRHLAAADALSGFLWRALGDPEQGGVFVDDASPRDAKAQNPHMHLLEAYLFLYEASGAERYLAQARALARLFAQRMFQADLDALPEHFSRDWRRREPGAFEPGHHFEWIWLLAKFDDAAGEDHADLRAKLWRKALAEGLDAQGRCFDEVAIPDIQAVTARAFAPLPQLIDFAEPWLRRGAVGIFPRGRTAQAQVETLETIPQFQIETFPSKIDADARIVRVRSPSQSP